MSLLALDIGGANLKAATARGYAASRPFALWRAPGDLADQLRQVIAAAPPAKRLAATMTGELADCFHTKSEGVHAIVDAVVAASGGRETFFYATSGALLPPSLAKEQPLAVAASNWHALASFAARFTEGEPAVLLDIGSTTTDVIPLDGRAPVAAGFTDPERLLSGELCYTGVERTPIAAIVSCLPWRGGACPVASEMFAWTADAYLLLGDLPENPIDRETADGRPRTRSAARARLARMVCADETMFSESEAMTAAAAIRDAQQAKIRSAIEQVLTRCPFPPARVILSGHGEFLARRVLAEIPWSAGGPQLVSIDRALGPEVSRCAPAYALAVRAGEELGSALDPPRPEGRGCLRGE